MNEVRLRNLKDSFKNMGIGPGSGHNNEVFSVEEVEALLVNVFQLATTDREHLVEQEKCVELTLSFLLKCLDRYIPPPQLHLLYLPSVSQPLKVTTCHH